VLSLAIVLAGCGGSGGEASYEPGEVESAFREAGLQLQRLPSVGAEQPAMGETSSCGVRYLAPAVERALSVSVCDDARDAEEITSDPSMQRANVAVEYAGDDSGTHERISRALDALER
jgi:hypothetical protein